MAQDFNATLNLPETGFSMRGNLTQKEPGMLEKWDEQGVICKFQSGTSCPMRVL